MNNTKMYVKGVVDEDFVNYKLPSMFVACRTCTFKCDRKNGGRVCQNSALANSPDIAILISKLVDRYFQNDISKAIVFGGLEPFEQFDDIYEFIRILREDRRCNDPVVIYTGFDKTEILLQVETLRLFKNVIIKFGRYIPGQEPHYDDVLGVQLASDNQYAEIIS